MPAASLVAVVLAGARSARLGGADKAMLELDGDTLLDRALTAATPADQIVVVGPVRPGHEDLLWCEEKPAGGGPVAAFAAGLATARPSELALLLASDLPFVAGGVTPLLEALTGQVDVAVLVDADGRPNYLASAWRRTSAATALASLGDPTGQPMRRLLDGLVVAEVRDTGGWGFDCDTWEALDDAIRRGATKRDE